MSGVVVTSPERFVTQRKAARLAGVRKVDISTDREVWMLYSSFLRRLGPGSI